MDKRENKVFLRRSTWLVCVTVMTVILNSVQLQVVQRNKVVDVVPLVSFDKIYLSSITCESFLYTIHLNILIDSQPFHNIALRVCLLHKYFTVKLGGSKLLKKFGVTWVHCFNLKFVFVFTEKKV